jgi:nicotinamidase-related amidase
VKAFPAETALIVIDVHNALDDPRWAAGGRATIPAPKPISRLLAACRTSRVADRLRLKIITPRKS